MIIPIRRPPDPAYRRRVTGKRLLVPVLLAGAMVAAAVPATAAPSPVRFELPEPTGPYRVGTTDLHLVDHARPDPWVPGTTRELMVTVRYPAMPSGNDAAPFLPPAVAEAVAEGDAKALRIDPAELDYGFATHSVTDAPALPGRRPVVLSRPAAATRAPSAPACWNSRRARATSSSPSTTPTSRWPCGSRTAGSPRAPCRG